MTEWEKHLEEQRIKVKKLKRVFQWMSLCGCICFLVFSVFAWTRIGSDEVNESIPDGSLHYSNGELYMYSESGFDSTGITITACAGGIEIDSDPALRIDSATAGDFIIISE